MNFFDFISQKRQSYGRYKKKFQPDVIPDKVDEMVYKAFVTLFELAPYQLYYLFRRLLGRSSGIESAKTIIKPPRNNVSYGLIWFDKQMIKVTLHQLKNIE